MKSIKIISKTDKGTLAIEHHIHESITAKKKSKLTFKMLGYKQEIIDNNPLTLELTLNNKHFQRLVKSKDIILKINEALNENGAIEKRDYFFEVVE